MMMTEVNMKAMRSALKSYKPVLDEFLAEEHMQWLVEFSSICAFPGAKGQQLHRDMSIQDKRLVTIFINLLDVDEKSGPLLVISGSQNYTWEDYSSSPRYLALEDFRVMTLPRGSSVLMDSRVLHSGTANTSLDCMRPVFYFSFGEKDINGPTYSIRKEYSGRYKLNDFYN
ncbi:Phytanoyl-CoA dioxygenase (PhyH) [Prochlorococcus marinus str. MIT 1313]|nr:Phytanoyl-CoA dioxygenase (PhyH) [Prochlorococcus marinus str. MIT 1313]KZR72638.1 Phytanoyl-CoA dioxygenase (PhyH) [Prochlorococcus marinus str. MIT 1318]